MRLCNSLEARLDAGEAVGTQMVGSVLAGIVA
jgi:hypothetical protein